jgi:hypothetical protein
VLRLAFTGFIGWMLVAPSNLAADLDLIRLNREAEDNLLARKQVTQVRVRNGALNILIVVMTIAAALMTCEQVQQFGGSLFASAGIAGIVVGLAARPMLSNLIAGVRFRRCHPRDRQSVIPRAARRSMRRSTATTSAGTTSASAPSRSHW